MAEETEVQAAAAGTPWILIGLMGLLCSAGGAAGGFFLSQKAAPSAQVAEAAAAQEVAPFGERVLELDPFVVNVGDEGYPRYLKLDLAFELDSPESRADLEQRVPQVRDMTIILLSSKRLTELSEFEGKALLKEDLRERVSALLEAGSVESVMFTEFVVQ